LYFLECYNFYVSLFKKEEIKYRDIVNKSEAFPDLPMGLVYLLYVCPGFQILYVSLNHKRIPSKRRYFFQIADALYYNAALTLSILQKLGVASEIFHLWFQLLQQVKKSGMRANFKRFVIFTFCYHLFPFYFVCCYCASVQQFIDCLMTI